MIVDSPTPTTDFLRRFEWCRLLLEHAAALNDDELRDLHRLELRLRAAATADPAPDQPPSLSRCGVPISHQIVLAYAAMVSTAADLIADERPDDPRPAWPTVTVTAGEAVVEHTTCTGATTLRLVAPFNCYYPTLRMVRTAPIDPTDEVRTALAVLTDHYRSPGVSVGRPAHVPDPRVAARAGLLTVIGNERQVDVLVGAYDPEWGDWWRDVDALADQAAVGR